jgi:hypothetical protein
MSPRDPIWRQNWWRAHNFVRALNRPIRSQKLKIGVWPARQQLCQAQSLRPPLELKNQICASHLICTGT